jgi:small subunit ribosomal protein S17
VAAEPAVAEEPPAEEAGGAPPQAAPTRAPRPRRSREERAARTAKKKARRSAAQTGERAPIVRLPKPEHERGLRKERRGVVVSSAMDKTIVVRVDTVKPDRRYKKVVRRSAKFHAHDERNEANVGDIVRIVESRPLSKTKNWRLAEVIEAAR